jgi:hypothetical protein
VRIAPSARATPLLTAEIHPAVVEALGREHGTLATLRYDLSKIRAKGPVAKLPNSHPINRAYAVCLVFLKLFERVYAPFTAGPLSPIKAGARLNRKGDRNLIASISALSMISIPSSRRHLKVADNDANEDKIPVTRTTTV